VTVQAAFAATLVDEFVRGGVTDAVVSPGSRSTPLVLAAARDGRLRLHVVLDERSAGFFALGLGLASGRPTLVVTTSGTAAVELHPALVEASQAGVPLLACTADRPPELHGVGAPQTVEQVRLFADNVRWSADPGLPPAEAWRSIGSRAVAEATGPRPGPVHLNLAFREPLVGEPDTVVPGRRGAEAWHVTAAAPTPPSAEVVRLLAEGGRGVILAGAGAGEPAAAHALADALGWPVLADPRSGCRVPAPTTVAAADALVRVPAFADAHRPDLVLRLGAPWASRLLGEWLSDAHTVLADPHGMWLDPWRNAAVVARCDPTLLCRAVADAGPQQADAAWLSSWQRAEAAAQAAFDTVLSRYDEPTEPGLARALAAALPDEATLVVSSSMPVRDVEWYAAPRTGLRVLANRGANGIDGVTSTALGVAAVEGWGPAAALLGDLAFLHDTNGLLIPPGTAAGVDCLLVVVDNDGGGIFSFLPQRGVLSEARFERLFGTPHGLDLCAVAEAHGVPAARLDRLADLPSCLRELDGVRMVHVRTDRDANVAVHDELHAAVAAALSPVL
jgi:2-succinyl-5-enolpyruvyl-6-hydroxy-3-cyclohexene-1-carboxylate synthase